LDTKEKALYRKEKCLHWKGKRLNRKEKCLGRTKNYSDRKVVLRVRLLVPRAERKLDRKGVPRVDRKVDRKVDQKVLPRLRRLPTPRVDP